MPLPLVATLTLGADHSMMINHKPRNLDPQRLSDSYFNAIGANPQSIEKFGLFSSIDYNTFYPDVEAAQFNPAEDEFIEPVFRLISNCIVSKNYNPTEFPADVLKASMPLLVGQTINCDHSTDIANAIGSIKAVTWQEAYSDKGLKIPAGINGVFRIDGKANPRIARGINMDPPSIHSNSVTVQFEWKPSHEFEHEWEFWDKLGTYAKDGTMVRRIVTKIISYKETSLVSHGADPYAQIIRDGKIINPGYADSVYNSFSEQVKERVSNSTRDSYFFDFKNILRSDTVSNAEADPLKENSQKLNINPNNQSNTMQELQAFLESLFGEGMLSLGEGQTASSELVLSEVKRLLTENKSLSEKVTASEASVTELQEKVANLEKDAKANASFIQMGQDHFKEVKEATLASYKKLMGEKEDSNILTLIENVDSLSTLLSLKANYDAQLEEKFPLHCADCGSKNVNRGSSVDSNKEHNEKVNDTQSILQKIAKSKQ